MWDEKNTDERIAAMLLPTAGGCQTERSFNRPVLSPSLSMDDSIRSSMESQRLLSGVSFS